MPELPEVEVVRRGLERVLPGQRFGKVEVRDARCFHGETAWLEKAEVQSLTRRGKLLQIHLKEGWSILVHLRMTGQLIYVPAGEGAREGGGHPSVGLVAQLPTKHTHVILPLESGDTLYFNDQRKFGSLKVVPTNEVEDEPFLQRLGPEPWDDAFDLEYLWAICQRRAKTTIKAVLLDQSVIAGLGNIYVDESLFLAGIRPTRKAGRVRKKELRALMKTIPEVLERGIEFGGVSARDYVNAEGLRGKMQEQLYVYRREGQPCKVCGFPIEKTSTAGRGTHYCIHCQPSR